MTQAPRSPGTAPPSGAAPPPPARGPPASLAELGVGPKPLDALERMDDQAPTPVQAPVAEPGRWGVDLLARSDTGPDKTIAWGIPLLAWGTEAHDARPTKALAPAPPFDLWVMAGTPALQANKRAAVQAARAKGASDDWVDVILAIGMAESHEMKACDRDASKDNAGLAKNYSAFNMNGDMLSRLGFVEGQGPDLNDQANVAVAVDYLLRAIDKMTLDGFLCFHRGGCTAYEDRTSYGAQTYVTAMKQVAAHLKAHPEGRDSTNRICVVIPHL